MFSTSKYIFKYKNVCCMHVTYIQQYYKYADICNKLINCDKLLKKCQNTEKLKSISTENKIFLHTVPKKYGNNIIMYKIINKRCLILAWYIDDYLYVFDKYKVNCSIVHPFRKITFEHYENIGTIKSDYNKYVHYYTYWTNL